MAALLDEARPHGWPEARIRLPEFALADLLDDLFRPIARDGAAIVEVAIKLQRSLAEIAAIAPEAYGLLAVRAADALARCEAAMASTVDLNSVRAVFNAHWILPKEPRA